MHRARGLWRAGVAAALGGSRALSRGPGTGSGCSGGGLGPEAEADPALLHASSPELARRLCGLALVRGGFVSEGEAVELLREVEPGLRRGRYQNDHWDRFCGCTIVGLSLLSPSVLRLQSLRDPQDWLELLLEPGSLYVLRGAARYEFTHEILPDEKSFFRGLRVPRGRRVALIFRNDPPETPPEPLSNLPAFIEDPHDPPPPK
ncbi:alpha-ketoglutarate-dependent dioxygenase alkB homolog 7, mitochondrial [Cinclus cinclus]|uniref:alpha-ketoglutarate-dependent dioxygenase alkB homolog 7, mitochondrial n=1 Tax=Cinclus cinclus TaxID=127875 RepID=UPI002E13803D